MLLKNFGSTSVAAPPPPQQEAAHIEVVKKKVPPIRRAIRACDLSQVGVVFKLDT